MKSAAPDMTPDMTEKIHNNDPVAKLKLYMEGWKLGASAAPPKYNSGPHMNGYNDGMQARIVAQGRAADMLSISHADLLDRVMR